MLLARFVLGERLARIQLRIEHDIARIGRSGEIDAALDMTQAGNPAAHLLDLLPDGPPRVFTSAVVLPVLEPPHDDVLDHRTACPPT